jgi:hypothetical protein
VVEKSKNGKEIYEGDIVEVEGDAAFRSVVRWSEEFAGWDCEGVGLHELMRNDLLVIGNVYENPELVRT